MNGTETLTRLDSTRLARTTLSPAFPLFLFLSVPKIETEQLKARQAKVAQKEEEEEASSAGRQGKAERGTPLPHPSPGLDPDTQTDYWRGRPRTSLFIRRTHPSVHLALSPLFFFFFLSFSLIAPLSGFAVGKACCSSREKGRLLLVPLLLLHQMDMGDYHPPHHPPYNDKMTASEAIASNPLAVASLTGPSPTLASSKVIKSATAPSRSPPFSCPSLDETLQK